MDKVNSFIKCIISVIKKIKLSMIFEIIFVFSMFLLFVPNKILGYIGVINFVDKYREYISILFICSIAYFIVLILDIIKSKFEKIKFIHSIRKYLRKELSFEESEFLISNYYNSKTNQFELTGIIPYNSGIKAQLEIKKILYLASYISSSEGFIYFPYNLQPYVLQYLNKSLEANKLIIKDNKLLFISKRKKYG